ncbi:DNA repair RAD51-like protein 3 [Lamellibrachia satsuma]|nr:DNA repair RAD51-like protein 3 [Lamellibrachia satsuma]
MSLVNRSLCSVHMLAMQRELGSFPLTPGHRQKLHNAGFLVVEDVLQVKPDELGREIGVTHEEVLDILTLVKGATKSPTATLKDPTMHLERAHGHMTLLDMLQEPRLQQYIVTFSEQLDGILGGGVPLTRITEFCGAPGIGKTQICMQLAVDVQIPECFGGVCGETVYIDTEGTFIVDRIKDIAMATMDHCQQMAAVEASHEQQQALQTFTLESILGGIHYFRCHDYVELIAVIHILPKFLVDHANVRLVVLDSVASPFRHHFDDYSRRTRVLSRMAQNLNRMANVQRLAVVLTNQMTTKFTESMGQRSHLVPALGETWGHTAAIRVVLHWVHQQRCALLYKSSSCKQAVVPYQITPQKSITPDQIL